MNFENIWTNSVSKCFKNETRQVRPKMFQFTQKLLENLQKCPRRNVPNGQNENTKDIRKDLCKMNTIELLSPVGDFDCLKAAVQAGADCVYFGGNLFNARASANNFNDDELKRAIEYAKIRKVKTNLTLNVLIKNDEFMDAINLARKAYEYGVDAIIVQDLGLARKLIELFPDLPIHASTQMTVHNLDGVLEAERLGFKRVVLSRELSMDEIKYICDNSNIEIEVFVHGALCICYSGQCLLSSMIGGRSRKSW